MIYGLLQANSGSIEICGNKPGVETKKVVAYLPDNIFLNNWMRVEQIVEMFADFYADFRKELAYSMLERLGVDKKKKLKTKSQN